MPGDDDAFEVVGELSPTELARHLGWSPGLVHDLIDQGAIVRSAAGWRIDSTELSYRWAQTQWDSGAGQDVDPSRPPDAGRHTDGES